MDQSPYQVRFDWGLPGLSRLAPSDIVVLVDVLDSDDGADAARLRDAVTARDVLLFAASIGDATTVADRILAEQVRRDRRTSVSVVAVGSRDRDGSVRFAVEDLLGAGAVLDALIDRGIDHTSPEAVVAAEAFRALRGASRHLVSASATARAMRDDPERHPDAAATIRDATAPAAS